MRGERALRLLIREELTRLDEVTVGDLKRALEFAKGKKKEDLAKTLGKQAGKVVGMKVLQAIPFLGTAAAAVEAGMELKDLYDTLQSTTPEVKKKNPIWDRMTIDPETAAIVDDQVEDEFIGALGDRVSGLADDVELPDADEQLASWMRGKFTGRHVARGD